MLYLEGGQIMTDTVASAQQNFSRVEELARHELKSLGATKKVDEIKDIQEALFREIRNPLNCGQGPEANRLIGELQRRLPGFKPLSNARNSCAQAEALVADYSSRIDDLISRAAWNDSEFNTIRKQAEKNREALSTLGRNVSKNYDPVDLPQLRGLFEGFQADYQRLVYRLEKKDVKDSDLPKKLDLIGLESLGNVYRLPALFLSRLGEIQTSIYLLLALGFDLLLVYLFQMTTRNREKRYEIDSALVGGWQNGDS
jgi:hypothetical protein